MSKSQVFNGARALLMINNKAMGFFNNISWSVRQEKIPAFAIGSHSPRELTPVSQEAIQVNLAGFRVVGGSPTKVGFAKLQELLSDDVEISVIVQDRRSKDGSAYVFEVESCKVLENSGGVAAKGISDFRLTVIGLRYGDESVKASNNTDNAGTMSINEIDDGATIV